MKQTLACLLVLFSLFAFAACSSDGDASDGDAPDGDEPDGDEPDGDEPDGDEPDGDEPDGDAPDGDTPDGDTPDGDAPDGDTPDGDAPDGDEPDGDLSCDESVVTQVNGSVIDGSNSAISAAIALVCLWFPDGLSTCLRPATTDTGGAFSQPIPESNQCVDHAAVRLMNTADLTWTQVACPLDVSAGGMVSMQAPARLVSVPDATARDALGDTSQPHTITAAGGTELVVVPDDLQLWGNAYTDLRLLEWDAQTYGWPCFIDAAEPPDALVALVPELEVNSADAVHIRFPNANNLAAGTTVDVYAMGSAGTKNWDDETVEEGMWEVVTQATVSADGQFIETQAEAGLPFYTWVGYKAAQ